MFRNLGRAGAVVVGMLVGHLLGKEASTLVAWYLAFEVALILFIVCAYGQGDWA